MSVGEWIGVASFVLGILGTLWKISDTLNTTLNKLNYEIKQLGDSLSESKADRALLHQRINKTDKRVTDHEYRINSLERGK